MVGRFEKRRWHVRPIAVLLAGMLAAATLIAGCGGSKLQDRWIMGLYSRDWVKEFFALTPASEHSWIKHPHLTVGWEDIERRQDQFDFTALDAEVALLEQNGAEDFLFTLDKYLPAWAGPRYGPPDNMDDWRDFIRTVAEHYKDKVDFYQIWNEPSRDIAWQKANNSKYLLFGGDVRTDYPRMLQAAYEEIKAVDKDTMVICAALNDEKDNSTRPEGGTGLYDEMFRPPGKLADYCDAIAVHPYYQPEEWAEYYRLVQGILDGYGIKDELVVTEIGSPHNYPNGPEIQRQAMADVGIGALVEAGCRKFWVYTDLDDPPEQRYDFDYGLFDYQGNPMPAWQSYKDWVTDFETRK